MNGFANQVSPANDAQPPIAPINNTYTPSQSPLQLSFVQKVSCLKERRRRIKLVEKINALKNAVFEIFFNGIYIPV